MSAKNLNQLIESNKEIMKIIQECSLRDNLALAHAQNVQFFILIRNLYRSWVRHQIQRTRKI